MQIHIKKKSSPKPQANVSRIYHSRLAHQILRNSFTCAWRVGITTSTPTSTTTIICLLCPNSILRKAQPYPNKSQKPRQLAIRDSCRATLFARTEGVLMACRHHHAASGSPCLAFAPQPALVPCWPSQLPDRPHGGLAHRGLESSEASRLLASAPKTAERVFDTRRLPFPRA